MRESETVEQFISDSRKFLEELKSKQQVGGLNVLYYFTGNGDPYDFHVLSLANGIDQKYRLTFTFATAQHGALVGVTAFYRINNPNVLGSPVEPTGVVPQIQIRQDDLGPYMSTQYIVDFTIINNSFIGVPTNYDVYIKFFITGTDTGTYEIHQI